MHCIGYCGGVFCFCCGRRFLWFEYIVDGTNRSYYVDKSRNILWVWSAIKKKVQKFSDCLKTISMWRRSDCFVWSFRCVQILTSLNENNQLRTTFFCITLRGFAVAVASDTWKQDYCYYADTGDLKNKEIMTRVKSLV